MPPAKLPGAQEVCMAAVTWFRTEAGMGQIGWQRIGLSPLNHQFVPDRMSYDTMMPLLNI
jgi:hypothetical protein